MWALVNTLPFSARPNLRRYRESARGFLPRQHGRICRLEQLENRTLLSVGTHAFSDDFSSATLNPLLEDPADAFTLADGVIRPHTDRQYCRTVESDYISGDFTFEIDVNLTTTEGVIELGARTI